MTVEAFINKLVDDISSLKKRINDKPDILIGTNTDDAGLVVIDGDVEPSPVMNLSDNRSLIFRKGTKLLKVNSPSNTSKMNAAGALWFWTGDASTIPDGWLECRGQELSTSAYPELFAAIGYKWGGSGTTFSIPDLRGRFPLGVDSSHALGSTGGEEEHTLTVDEMPNHNHKSGAADEYAYTWRDSTFERVGSIGGVDALSTNISFEKVVGAAGGSQPHNNMPPYVAGIWIICTGRLSAIKLKGEKGDSAGVNLAGTTVYFYGSTIPEGWLLCDGSSVSRTRYPQLFEAIGYKYGGSGDTFYLPHEASKIICAGYTAIRSATTELELNGNPDHSFYAPTTTGSYGQVLTSSGANGEPVWKDTISPTIQTTTLSVTVGTTWAVADTWTAPATGWVYYYLGNNGSAPSSEVIDLTFNPGYDVARANGNGARDFGISFLAIKGHTYKVDIVEAELTYRTFIPFNGIF